jgi:chromosome partitioning protein
MRTILIASPKGGCGKTTVATNLAAFYATADKETALVDCDRQGSSLHWAEKRAALAHPVLGMAGKVGSKVTAKVPTGTKRCIVDTAAGIRVSEVAELLEAADALVIPVMPSVIDLEASEAFFADLAELPAVKRKKFPVAIVANRTKPWTNATQMAVARLKASPFPVIAELRDSQGYVLLAGLGKSLFDYHSEQTRSHQDDWAPLLKWLKKLD